MSHAQLNKWERGQFVEVAESTQGEVSAQFLSELGCGVQMVNGLRGLGAKIEFADETTGYVLVKIPREKLVNTLDLPGIAYASIRAHGVLYYQYPVAKTPTKRKPEAIPAITIPYSRVARTLLKDGPYCATDEIGLSDLWKLNPKADGRGVRVAVSDLGFDLLHPALQQARDAEGKIVPKVADLTTLTTPEEDASWVTFGEPMQSKNGQLETPGHSWIVPEDGTYRFGIFTLDLVLGEQENSHAKKLHLSVGILWSEQRNLVWVDTDGDGSFKNQRALGDYAATHDIDWFGKEVGDQDNRIPFGVKIDTAKDAVYIRIGGDHGAMVAGPLAANTLTDGLFNGAAPAAQLLDDQLSVPTSIASMVGIASRPDVDVINRSGGIGRVGLDDVAHPMGYEDFAQRVLERTIAIYDKPIVAYSAASGVIHVTDYAGSEMLRRNRQLAPPYLDTINSFVWDLPNGLVNTVLAPSANLETESRYMPISLKWEDGKRRTFADDSLDPPAPDGYAIGWNNSPAIPVVSGILADLISEARRVHVRYNAKRLNNAIFTGARLLPGFPLSQQGYGLINAANSWNQLAKMARADDPANSELTSFAVSRMEDGKSVEVQGFHANLDKPGGKLEGEIWITRRGGYAGGRKYAFALRGNDGDYTLLDHEAVLDRDKPVRIRFRTDGQSGWNIIFLEIRDVTAHVVMQDVPLSVRVPDVPKKSGPGVDEYESTIQPLRSEHRYVRVGEGVQAVRYIMHIPYTGSQNISTRHFPGFYFEEKAAPPGEPVDAAHHVGPMETLQSLVINNASGTQDCFWENRGRPEYATQYDGQAPDVPIHAKLTVIKYAVAITKTQPQTLSVTNQLSEVDGRVELYDAKLTTSELHGQGNHAIAESEYAMPASLAEWRAQVTGVIAGVHTDVYLFNCAGKNACYIVSQQEITDKGASLVVDKPEAGTWKIVVRSREQVTGGSGFKLTGAQLTPTQTSTAEANTRHSSGEKWTLALPSTTQYAAFRIAGTPGVESEKDGLLIAMTPLVKDIP
ncbi:MAG TPA: S8 family serine peptidase [Bryobacteraceae bacterium]|jgi:hypothetical protein